MSTNDFAFFKFFCWNVRESRYLLRRWYSWINGDYTMDSNSRTLNFTKKETSLLLDLVKTHKDVIECKKSDCKTWKQKELEWEKLAQEFNNLNEIPFPRNAKNLKNKWDNLKKVTKKKFAIEKQNRMKTGGGQFMPVDITNEDLEIKELLGTSCVGLENFFDSDNIEVIYTNSDDVANGLNEIQPSSCVTSNANLPHLESHGKPLIEENVDDTNKKWCSWTPAILKTPMSSELSKSTSCKPETSNSMNELCRKGKEKKRKTALTQDCRVKISILSEARLELVHIQRDCYREEMKIKEEQYKQCKEIHALEIEKRKMEIDILKRKLEKE